MSSSSISLACTWQSQTPLLIDRRSGLDRLASYRGPPGAAAVMWAATPVFETLTSVCEDGPVVARPHHGQEHLKPARLASDSRTVAGKSSRAGMTNTLWRAGP